MCNGWRLGAKLGVPTSSSVGDLRVMIEAKLREMDCDPANVQVALSRNSEDTGFSVVDHSGVFLTIEPRHEVLTASDKLTPSHVRRHPWRLLKVDERIQALTQERGELQGRVKALTEENSALLTELHTMQGQLESSKARVKKM